MEGMIMCKRFRCVQRFRGGLEFRLIDCVYLEEGIVVESSSRGAREPGPHLETHGLRVEGLER